MAPELVVPVMEIYISLDEIIDTLKKLQDADPADSHHQDIVKQPHRTTSHHTHTTQQNTHTHTHHNTPQHTPHHTPHTTTHKQHTTTHNNTQQYTTTHNNTQHNTIHTHTPHTATHTPQQHHNNTTTTPQHTPHTPDSVAILAQVVDYSSIRRLGWCVDSHFAQVQRVARLVWSGTLVCLIRNVTSE